MSLSRLWLPALLVLACLACGGASEAPPPPTATLPPATATPAPSPTPAPVRLDILARRLIIPSLNLDSPVQMSATIPYIDNPPPGCPAKPLDPDAKTLVVPDQGIATPTENLEGFENKAWIFGHSRWLGQPGLFLALQDLQVGDEVLIEGFDRQTGGPVEQRRFVVDTIYLADTDSGEGLINAVTPADIPDEPIVILQTSVRESGAGKPWILDQAPLQTKATNIVQGDLDDPCKYLLLFVFARPA